MLRKLLFSFFFLFLLAGTAVLNAQTGSLKIKLVDAKTHEPLPFASVLVEQNGAKVIANQTNFDGEVLFTALGPGKYDLKATYVGYQPMQLTGVIVSVDKITYKQFDLQTGEGHQLEVVDVVVSKVDLIDADVKSGTTFTRDQYMQLAQKDVNSIVASAAGVYQSDQKGSLNIRGSRGEGTAYYVDGVRTPTSSALGISQLGIEEITVITGGIPAQYGDATGGIIAVTTRGVQPNFFASVQGESSQYLDQFNHNLMGFSMGSPLYSTRDTAGHKKAVLGFTLSGDFTHDKDPYPSAIGAYQVSPAELANLQQNPIQLSADGSSFNRSAEFIPVNDLSHIQYQQNVAATGINLNGKIKYSINENTDLTIGGRFGYGNSLAYIQSFALFDANNNPQVINSDFSLNARIVERFNTKSGDEKDKTNSLVTNAVYTLQAEYSRSHQTVQDPNLQNNFFQYGYVGKFDVIQGKYDPWNDANGGYTPNFVYNPAKNAFVQQSLPGDSIILFTPNSKNLQAANYTSSYFNATNQNGANNVHSFGEIENGLGLLNGDQPGAIYSLYSNTGTNYNGYTLSENDQFRVYTNFQASIKNHSIQVGFEYQQNIESSFSLTPDNLWTQMRILENTGIQQMDTANGHLVKSGGPFNYILYDPKYSAAAQSQFDRSLRAKLGLPASSTTILNTDGMDPSTFSLSMFSPDNLNSTNGGASLESYYGYSYTGQKLTGSAPSFASYFTEKDANGNYTRLVAPFEPIYIAGYIQDQFDIADLKVRLGLRVDRYDANEETLKDQYSLYAIKTAGEVSNLPIPSNIPSNYVVYVNDLTTPTSIVGYRNTNATGTTWYTPQGVQVNNPSILSNNVGASQLYPYLVDPVSAGNKIVNPNAFTPYVAKINVMPRIAFAFPISDLAQFNANYDITTQRPSETGGYGVGTTQFTNVALPSDYLNWANNAQAPFIANAALLPTQTTNYEIGYKQVLSDKKNAAITISAFYKEMRNLEEVISVLDAYPATYTSFGNIDFATVKGMSAAFEMRRTHNVQLSANYTLQFANGTGSSASDGINLVNSGVPNIRTLLPLNYDRRHQLNLIIDYRYSARSEYNGPVWIRKKGQEGEKVVRLLENVGFNLSATAGSGTPYSRQANVLEDAANGINLNPALAGSVNGSNLPWSYRLDGKIDKSMRVTWRTEKEGKAAKVGNLNVYVRCLNLLNTQNILGVYRYTGNPNDDGFLESSFGKQTAAAQNSPAAFNSLYAIKVNNPANYSIPRSIMLGFIMDL